MVTCYHWLFSITTGYFCYHWLLIITATFVATGFSPLVVSCAHWVWEPLFQLGFQDFWGPSMVAIALGPSCF